MSVAKMQWAFLVELLGKSFINKTFNELSFNVASQ